MTAMLTHSLRMTWSIYNEKLNSAIEIFHLRYLKKHLISGSDRVNKFDSTDDGITTNVVTKYKD